MAQYLLRKKKGRTVVTEFGENYTTEHVFTGLLHSFKAKRWLRRNSFDWEVL